MKQFIHGNTYYSHAHPPEELDRNFKKMKELGLNAVRVAEIWPGWSVLEHTPGKYDYALLDDFVEKAMKNDIKVCMGVGINDTPFWLYSKYNDLRCVGWDDKKAVRRVQSACIDHMEYRNHMKNFIEDITKHYAGVSGIFSWQLGNEIRYGASYCDCPSTRIRFREWLKEKYKSDLDMLNREWGVYYHDWDEIYPYKSKEGPPTDGIPSHCLNTKQFMCWSLEELLRWGTDIMRKYTDLPIFHNNFQQVGNGNYWKLVEPCDVAVMDIYAVTYDEPGYYNGFLVDVGRSIADQQNKPFWIGEACAGQYGTFNRNYVDRRLVENCSIDQLGGGAQAIFYFRHKAPIWEQPHKFTGSQTFLRIDETEMEYAQTPKNIEAFIGMHEDRILNAKPVKAEVAVYYPDENINYGGEAGYKEDALHSAFGARAIWAGAQIPVEILDSEGISTLDLSRFKIVHIPVSYMLDSRVGAALKKYVAEGGTLICEGRPGYVNEYGLLYEAQPGAGLDEVFGAREDLFYNIGSYNAQIELECFSGRCTLSSLKQTYRLFGGSPFITSDSGEVCGVHNQYGKGHAYIFGGAPSLHYRIGSGKYEKSKGNTAVNTEGQREFFCNLFKCLGQKHGVIPPIRFAGGNSQLTVRYLERKGEIIMFMINYNKSEQAEIIIDDIYATVKDLSKEGEKLLTDRSFAVPELGWRVIAIQTEIDKE